MKLYIIVILAIIAYVYYYGKGVTVPDVKPASPA